MMFNRELLTRWAKTRGIDTGLFQTDEEWELLDGVAQLHCAIKLVETQKPEMPA
jgi:hypothetical protein